MAALLAFGLITTTRHSILAVLNADGIRPRFGRFISWESVYRMEVVVRGRGNVRYLGFIPKDVDIAWARTRMARWTAAMVGTPAAFAFRGTTPEELAALIHQFHPIPFDDTRRPPGHIDYILSGFASETAYALRSPTWTPSTLSRTVNDAVVSAHSWRTAQSGSACVEVIAMRPHGPGTVVRVVTAAGVEDVTQGVVSDVSSGDSSSRSARSAAS